MSPSCTPRTCRGNRWAECRAPPHSPAGVADRRSPGLQTRVVGRMGIGAVGAIGVLGCNQQSSTMPVARSRRGRCRSPAPAGPRRRTRPRLRPRRRRSRMAGPDAVASCRARVAVSGVAVQAVPRCRRTCRRCSRRRACERPATKPRSSDVQRSRHVRAVALLRPLAHAVAADLLRRRRPAVAVAAGLAVGAAVPAAPAVALVGVEIAAVLAAFRIAALALALAVMAVRVLGAALAVATTVLGTAGEGRVGEQGSGHQRGQRDSAEPPQRGTPRNRPASEIACDRIKASRSPRHDGRDPSTAGGPSRAAGRWIVR